MDAAAGPLLLARHDLSRSRPDRALARLATVTGAELEAPEFWSLRAQALFDLRRWDEAVAAARTGLEREPDDVELLDLIAVSELERGRKKQAQKAIDAAIALHPEAAVLHAHRGLILARSAQRSFRPTSYKKARLAVDQALRLDPDSEHALSVRAHIAVLSGERGAGEYAAELLARDPENEHAHVVAGAARERRGDASSALGHYEEAARLDPSDPDLAWLGRHSRVLRGRFAAPMLFAHRLTRGYFSLVWVFVALASFSANQPLLTALVFAFWAYTWIFYFYHRRRVGKVPK